jgi:transcriptional regulator with XRE-family HTH domain
MSAGSEIRRAREKAGLAQHEVAKGAKISRTYYNQLEADKKAMSLDVFLRICHALEIAPSKLISRIDKKE